MRWWRGSSNNNHPHPLPHCHSQFTISDIRFTRPIDNGRIFWKFPSNLCESFVACIHHYRSGVFFGWTGVMPSKFQDEPTHRRWRDSFGRGCWCPSVYNYYEFYPINEWRSYSHLHWTVFAHQNTAKIFSLKKSGKFVRSASALFAPNAASLCV